eukprot:TRINITY_DN16911_c0_g1_i1.p3 TRINITY_DN16911_c0_g1~~TRINITY_DN16911_c0_g1_i1.p3  ORF type:complete len:157 (+),score=26.90 TRINITY_DN16911_c0_g1_i1:541-1011(+)
MRSLDCSQIFVSVLLLCGCEPGTAARTMVVVSVPIVGILLAFGVWSWLGGSSMASLTIMMALWLGLQTWQLHKAAKQGMLGQMPLFATAAAAAARSSSQGDNAAGASASQSGGGFRPFQGQGNTLGKATPNEVCIASAVSFFISAALVSQVSMSSL